ncbi:SecY-interacting protein [Neiella marina]|uniref:SecY-interacting protein n=1 Tax=Neiella holothuriorum TaxID=2870530 RepID=A0ABS7EHN7_9GAMM|nr:SecY-interacting protein [Neiella holothuriorum]MBW8191854.1 SecY-interacting protein [Neiella holothuriorum]
MLPSTPIANALVDLIQRYQALYLQENAKPSMVDVEEDWLSPCLPEGAEEGEQVSWQPHVRANDDQFAELESAVGVDLHPDGKAYWNSLFSAGIYIQTEIGAVELLQPWNNDDYVRFLQNLTGHLLTQQRFKLEPSIFIGVSLNSEHVVSVADDGSVVVELPGRKPNQQLAPNLAEFLQQATPVILD